MTQVDPAFYASGIVLPGPTSAANATGQIPVWNDTGFDAWIGTWDGTILEVNNGTTGQYRDLRARYIGLGAAPNVLAGAEAITIANDQEIVILDNAAFYGATIATDSLNNVSFRNGSFTGSAFFGIGNVGNTTGSSVIQTAGANRVTVDAEGRTTFGKATIQSWVDATPGATVTFNLLSGNKQRVTLGANSTLALSNVTVGQVFLLRLLSDGTGRTVTWFSTIKWAGGSAPTQTATANKADVFGFICTSAGNYDGFVVGQNL